MKRTIFFLVFGMLVLNAQAKIWRVNNTPGLNADFSDISTAISSASAGDTLYIEGSAIPYSSDVTQNVSVTKSLCIIGPGYYLSKNDSTLYSKSNATINYKVTIQTTAPNTIIQGLCIEGELVILANNVTIQRNRIQTVNFGFTNEVTNTVIQGNYLSSNVTSAEGRLNNLIISNNIILGYILIRVGNSVIENNTILSNTLAFPASTGQQVGGLSIISFNSIISNNLCKGDIYIGRETSGIGTGTWQDALNSLLKNKINLGDNFTSQFIGGTIEDKYYILKPTSSAKGAGAGGIDCGAFGGSDPYVLSGLPAIPHIYDIVAPTSGSATSGLAVKVKVKTQK